MIAPWDKEWPPWGHRPTEHPCPACGEGLSLVDPSTMLACCNPECSFDEPLFLIPKDSND